MRILKRNLAFVLVMAMAIGMMVTASAANVEDYRDANDIKFTEAVDVLTALGILEGEDGTFHPERTLTREEGAKIITYLMLGGDAADNLSTSVAPFADVAAGRWSAGYIAYCVSQGIVGGYGNGNFGPTDTLTGTQFAKMLLVALGYGVNGEFTGANWEIETNKQALTAGIYEGNLGVNFSAGVKREEAAQYAFNTLANVMQVSYSDVFGAYYSGNIFDGDINEADEYKYTLGYNLYNLRKVAGQSDDFLRDCHVWKQNAKTLTGNYHDEADKIYTDNVKSSALYADLGLTGTVHARVIADGAVVTAPTVDENGVVSGGYVIAKDNTKNDQSLAEVVTTANVGKGVVVEAYADTTGVRETVTLIVTHVYLAQITDVNDDDNEVTVDVLTGEPDIGDGVFETAAEYEEDDYVLITAANSKIQSLKPVNTVEGKLNSVANTFVRFDGEQVNKALLSTLDDNKEIGGTADLDTDNEYTLLVDDYGYALGLVLVEEADDTVGYVYVTGLQGRSSTLLNGKAAVAEVRYLDGKGKEVLTLDTATQSKTVGDTKTKKNCFRVNGLDEGEALFTGSDITAFVDNWVAVEDIVSERTVDVNKFFAYSINADDELVLKVIDETKNEVKVLNGVVTFNGTATAVIDGNNLSVNGRSVVHVLDDDNNIKTSTGYKNIKFTDSDSDVLVVYTAANSGLIKEAYVLSADAKIGGNNDIYVWYHANADEVEVSGDNYTINLYSDANGTSYTIDSELYSALSGKGLYVITLDDENKITDIEAAVTEGDYTVTDNATVTVAGKGEAFSTSVRSFTLADDAVILNASGDTVKSATLTSVKVDFEVGFVQNDDGQVILLVITAEAE